MKPFFLYVVIGGGGIDALMMGIVLRGVLPGWRWAHEPLHSTLETVGGLAAISMGIVLLQRTAEHTNQKFYPIAGAFSGWVFLKSFMRFRYQGMGSCYCGALRACWAAWDSG